MKLISFEVHGLLGRDGRIGSHLKSDLNILTGRNGAGKTSILKLIWYIVSGNILLATMEVDFSKITIVTDLYTCTVFKISRMTCRVELTVDGETKVYEDAVDPDGDVYMNAEDLANPRLIEMGGSVFLPTFRRIEGGFTLTNNRSPTLSPRKKSDIEEALVSLSRKLTNDPHVFVSSISTVDIVSLLLRRYADLSELANSLQQNTSQEIISTIKAFKSDKTDSGQIDAANDVLDKIRTSIEDMENQRESIMAPIEAVTKLVEKLFRHSGIKFSARLSFGDAAGAVNSESLSAGEKQMLSFICYNAFYKNSVFFIDEPELSLHADWQRQLFPILLKQQSSNQFIIATHSPFIYSKYPDKEISISRDKGDLDNE